MKRLHLIPGYPIAPVCTGPDCELCKEREAMSKDDDNWAGKGFSQKNEESAKGSKDADKDSGKKDGK